MAKLPGWMAFEHTGVGYASDGTPHLTFRVRVRRWHPGFWWCWLWVHLRVWRGRWRRRWGNGCSCDAD